MEHEFPFGTFRPEKQDYRTTRRNCLLVTMTRIKVIQNQAPMFAICKTRQNWIFTPLWRREKPNMHASLLIWRMFTAHSSSRMSQVKIQNVLWLGRKQNLLKGLCQSCLVHFVYSVNFTRPYSLWKLRNYMRMTKSQLRSCLTMSSKH